MIKDVKYWLCWLAVIPGAFIAGVLACFPLRWVLHSTLTNFAEPYPELPERLLTPFVTAVTFIWAGSRIAPEYKVETSVILFGLWALGLVGTIFFTLSGANWMGRQTYFLGGGLGPTMAIAGALTGLYVVRIGKTK